MAAGREESLENKDLKVLNDGWLGWDLWQIARSEPASLYGEKQAPAEHTVCDLLHSMRGAEAEQPCDCKRS